MKSWRSFLPAALATIGFCMALAAGAAELKEGLDFRAINPPLAAPKDKIQGNRIYPSGANPSNEAR